MLRTIGAASAGQADIGKVVTTCRRIKEKDCDSWFSEWSKTANRIRKFGEESLTSGYTVSASQSFLRTASYYRTAEFYLNYGCNSFLMEKTDSLCTQCFNLGIQYGPYDIIPVEIPFEGTSLPGHFYRAVTDGKKCKYGLDIPSWYVDFYG